MTFADPSADSPDSPDPVVSSPSGSQPATGETPAPAGSTTPQAAPEATQFMDEHRYEVRAILARHASTLGGQGGTPGAPAGAQAAPNFGDLFTKYGPMVMELFSLFQKWQSRG